MKLYTVGFTQKSAESFFARGQRAAPGGYQAKPWATRRLREKTTYFLTHLADGCQYVYLPVLAPTAEIMEEYRAGGNWKKYASRFEKLMDERGVPAVLEREPSQKYPTCLLCSESTAEHCHRRLVAERLARTWPDVEVRHL
jgi:hypothetical protein